jgi:hypothetical protein
MKVEIEADSGVVLNENVTLVRLRALGRNANRVGIVGERIESLGYVLVGYQEIDVAELAMMRTSGNDPRLRGP